MSEDDTDRILNLDIGEETRVYTPNLNITYHTVRRTENGFETKSAITDWREVSEEEIRSVLTGTDR